MKRDMELVRQILLAVEEKGNGEPFELDLPNYSAGLIAYHVGLLDQAGFLTAHGTKPLGAPATYRPVALTWAGHDFLDAARNDSVWNHVKEEIGAKKLAAVPFEILKGLLVRAAGSFFGLE